MSALFLKTIGQAGTPVPANWLSNPQWQDRLGSVVFPKYPRSVTRGSRLIYYAAGKQRFCAVMEVVGDEPTDSGLERWPYELALRPLVVIPVDALAPSLADVGFDPLRVRRQSHVRLTDSEYTNIVAAILATATRTTRLERPTAEVA